MHPTVVLNVVGLTRNLIGDHTPHLKALALDGSYAPIRAVSPAVTCTVQSTYLTGTMPRHHGIVANGWYFRELAQVMFWKQANQLVVGEKIWDIAKRRDPACTSANLFWWYNMYSSVDWSVTPRPIYPADGRKIPDIYSHPGELCERLTAEIGTFPFFNFWGPTADIRSSRWIAESAIAMDRWFAPTLLLVYLPHLDYNLQRLGPGASGIADDVRSIDEICGRLIAHFRERGRRVVVLSEYGMTDVRQPIHINRALRQAGLLAVRRELGTEALDCGASQAFAVSDHQHAHVYINQPGRVADVKALLQTVPGIEAVLDRREQAALGLDHERSGELVAVANRERWFTYYYWLDDAMAPDYARTVDIHRKPGYDPAELFVDPQLRFPRLKIAATLARKALGFRYLMEVIPLDGGLIRGSHGRPTDSLDDGPVLISSEPHAIDGPMDATAVHNLLLSHLFDPTVRAAT